MKLSLKSEALPDLPPFETFAYFTENQLHSHRGIFQHELDLIKGIIIHLGNKDLEGEEDGGWFAGKLIEWSDGEIIFTEIEEDDGSEQWNGENQECKEFT